MVHLARKISSTNQILFMLSCHLTPYSYHFYVLREYGGYLTWVTFPGGYVSGGKAYHYIRVYIFPFE